MTEQTEVYRLHRVEIENVLKCTEFSWTDTGEPVVCLKGKNGAGKSSIQRAIAMALCGGGVVPDEVLHDGARSWRAEVTLGAEDGTELVVERKGKDDGKGSLTITAKDGSRLRSPQAVLDAIVSKVAVDPLLFLEADSKKQQEMLLRVSGVDFDLDEWAQRRAGAYEARRDANRDVKRLEAEAAAMGWRDEQAKIAEQAEIDVSAMIQRQEEATEHNSRVDNAKWHLQANKEALQRKRQDLQRLREQVAAMEGEVNEAQALLDAQEAECEKMEKVETSDIQEAIKEAHATNSRIQEAKRAVAKWEEVDIVQRNARHFDDQIAALDEEKAKTLASADLPVPGLEFDETGVRYKGQPMDQASTGERLTVAIAVAAAMNPRLRVLFIDEASVLDDDNLGVVEQVAREKDLQVWLNTIQSGRPGILIEDGVAKQEAQA